MSKNGSKALPATRRSFESTADRKWYLNDKAQAWLSRGNRARAQHFARQLAETVAEEGYSRIAVNHQVYLAFCAEVQGDWKEATKFRKREVHARQRALDLAAQSDAHSRYHLLKDFPVSDLRIAVDAWIRAATLADATRDLSAAVALRAALALTPRARARAKR